jgi:hypothetical protein
VLEDGKWYKISSGAFNAQAEAVCSRLALISNLYDFVEYDICKVGNEYATVSEDFIKGRRFCTIGSLHIKITGISIGEVTNQVRGMELLRYVRNLVKENIRLDLFEEKNLDRLSLMFQFDALVLNEDRHFYNIMFIEDECVWKLSPVFDFDCSLYSCVEDLDTVSTYVPRSLPFADTHLEQIEMFRKLSDAVLMVRGFDVDALLDGIWEDSFDIGKKEIKNYLYKFCGGLNT